MARLENELKFKLEQAAAVRQRMRQLGFRVIKPRRLESNWILDDAAGSLLRRQCLLRLRHSGSDWILTFKGKRLASRLKRRPEIETGIADGKAGLALLQNLGYRIQLRYDRRRTTFARAGQEGEIAWDETPMGTYLEIEGAVTWVRQTARELGLRLEDAEPRSYPAIYLQEGKVKK